VEDQHYQRPPYVNRAHIHDFERTNVTRCVALAHALNASNQKVMLWWRRVCVTCCAQFLAAYTLQPLKLMDDNVLYERPDDATDSPYVRACDCVCCVGNQVGFRFQIATAADDASKKKKAGDDDEEAYDGEPNSKRLRT
jgi:hypothetical protein